MMSVVSHLQDFRVLSSLQVHNSAGTWSLRSDVASVDGKMSELMASSDEKALKRWKVEREEYVQCRKTHSAALRNYLNSNKAEKEGQLGCLREAHESEYVCVPFSGSLKCLMPWSG
ncbi:hypothetical protein FRC12_006330 [Ceratobasidium sp. 428]|nr:hypothetical protein FRC12_006330 [Ceratobasidium sp. 428]